MITVSGHWCSWPAPMTLALALCFAGLSALKTCRLSPLGFLVLVLFVFCFFHSLSKPESHILNFYACQYVKPEKFLLLVYTMCFLFCFNSLNSKGYTQERFLLEADSISLCMISKVIS